MKTTHLVYIAAAALLIACSSSDPSTGSPGSSGSSGSTPTSSSSSSGSTASATQEEAIDGTWDITAAGSSKIGASSMTIKGGSITGTIVSGSSDDESGTDGSSCTGTDKTAFSIVVSGDTATTTLTTTTDYVPANCSESEPTVSNLTVKRTAGSNTKNDTWSGDWAILDKDDNTPAIAINIVGLVVKAWGNADKTGNPVVSSTIANGQANNVTSESDVTFAARRR